MKQGRIKVGIVGCGNISSIYLKNIMTFPFLELAACADLDLERAKAKAQEFGIPKACSPKQLLDDDSIRIVVNLTVPKVHSAISLQAIRAGKSVHSEKPLGIARQEGRKVLEAAKAKRVLVGCAPDTFLGAGLQTCRKLIDDGWIGQPLAATAFMMGQGPDNWHPNPFFFYETGGGPMLDMGPYYLTALVSLLGPVKRVGASTKITFAQRPISGGLHDGKKIPVSVPTHLAGVLDFADGTVVTLITSFDIRGGHSLPCIEIYGTSGAIRLPDPNTFGGPVLIRRDGATEWKEVPLTHSYAENSRGLGVADMARAILTGRKNRASGEMAYHVLDVMQAFEESSRGNKHIAIQSTCHKPAPMPLDLAAGQMD